MKSMRISALLLTFGLAGTGIFRINQTAPDMSHLGGSAQSMAGGVSAQAPPKLQLQAPKFLDLNPDLTATAEVIVRYPKVEATSASANEKPEQKQTTRKLPVKNQKTAEQITRRKADPPRDGQGSAQDKGPVSGPAVAVKLYFDMQSSNGYPACTATVTPLIAEPSIKPGDQDLKMQISITSCNPKGGDGVLFLSANKAQGVVVKLKPRRSPWLAAIVIGSLVVAVLICVFAGKAVSAGGHRLGDIMNQVSWDFSTSWASNITAFGAAFVFLLNLGASLDRPHLGSKGEYQFIAAFALALAMLAPAVHRLASATQVVNLPQSSPDQGAQNAQSDPNVVTVGFVGGFLAASAFTIWGTLLQNAGQLLIVYELKRAGSLYGPILLVVGTCVAVTAVLLMLYCWNGILSTVAANAMRTGHSAVASRSVFQSAPANGETLARRAISGRRAAVL